MKIVSTITEYKNARRQIGGSLGFVPTMGYLHEGHLSLVRRARSENDFTAASIFVNPSQFGPKEDFATYPRDPDKDLRLLEDEGTDLVFMPAPAEIYPEGYSTWVNVEKITERLEGAVRPGHFRGVATVVCKLFNIAEPTRAYFGQKDAQQVVVVSKMVADLNMNVEIVIVPTVRESDGLAMSSRNVYLDPQERQSALVLWKSLQRAKELWLGGERRADAIRSAMTAMIESEPSAGIEYISIARPDNLEEIEEIRSPVLVSLAVRFGKTRLIDNMMLEA